MVLLLLPRGKYTALTQNACRCNYHEDAISKTPRFTTDAVSQQHFDISNENANSSYDSLGYENVKLTENFI